MKVVSATIEFPFERNRLYPIRELRTFEAELLVARQRDKELSNLLRNPNGPAARWMRVRNKELVPLKLYADHVGLSDNDEFLLSAEGDPVDAQIIASTKR